MTPSGPILVGIADGRDQDPALRFACGEATRSGRALRLVHVVVDASRAPAALLADAAARVDELAAGTVTVETATGSGAVVEQLVEMSEDAFLVVLQRRQLSRLQRLVTGSISIQVAGQARTPTVSVPADWRPAPAADLLGVTVGIDGADDEASHLLRHAYTRAHDLGVAMTIVHGWQLPSAYDDAILDPRAVEVWQDRYVRSVHRRQTQLGADHRFPRAEVRVRHMAASQALILASKESQLLVVGRGGLNHPVVNHLGSVTRAVMQSSECPVEVIEAHEQHSPLDSPSPQRPRRRSSSPVESAR
jgi:nucleotide-binding universal stress UspA family protein